jgi:mannose-1-phosphate guanylyltransferase
MSNNNYVIIMAGGVGTRFWPFSRTTNPKQFHDVLGIGTTMIQQTVERFDGICPRENIYIVTSKEYYEITKQQLPYLSDDQILLEPNRRNTAPCIAYACYKIGAKNPNANIVVAPADHIILKEDEFRKRINIALHFSAKNDVLVTLGIKPTRPDTVYGYIQFSESEGDIKRVVTFTEKPNLEWAQKFVESGEFVWNAGIFIWNVNAIKKCFEEFLPEMAEAFEGTLVQFIRYLGTEALVKAYRRFPEPVKAQFIILYPSLHERYLNDELAIYMAGVPAAQEFRRAKTSENKKQKNTVQRLTNANLLLSLRNSKTRKANRN